MNNSASTDPLLNQMAESLRQMIYYFGNPRKDEWLNETAYQEAKKVETKARQILLMYDIKNNITIDKPKGSMVYSVGKGADIFLF